MKKYFAVSFKYSEDVFCSNIAHAENAEAVNAHYSKYEWVKVRECEEWEVETARRKGMPIVEIVTAEPTEEKEEVNTMKEFTEIKKIVTADAEKTAENRRFYILNGYMPTWAAENHGDADRGLKEYSTETRWTQYKRGIISREKAVEYAIKRAVKAIEKDTAAKLATLDRIAAAPDLDYISISVEWVRSRVWGYNPTAEINAGGRWYTGHTSGCGYDKESAAVAEALNQSDSVLKALYTLKENGLKAGQSDESTTACCGRDNRNICGYGSGYGAIPYFEGGVGVSCFWSILDKCGFTVTSHHGKHSDYYTVEKGV